MNHHISLEASATEYQISKPKMLPLFIWKPITYMVLKRINHATVNTIEKPKQTNKDEVHINVGN